MSEVAWGPGDVAMFPRGAVNHPAIFASSCILFDSVTVLRPIDVEATHWDEYWQYERLPNPNADAFWKNTRGLVSEGVLRCITPTLPADFFDVTTINIDQELANDAVQIVHTGPGWVTHALVLGYHKYFSEIEKAAPPLVFSPPEMSSPLLTSRLAISGVVPISASNSLAVRVLSECVPQLDGGLAKYRFARRILEVRNAVREERRHFQAFIGLVASTLVAIATPEEKLAQLETIVTDCVEVYEAYSSKLLEITRRFSLPLRFVSILKDIITFDVISAAKDTASLGTHGGGVLERQEKRAFGFVKHVEEQTDFWARLI